ncbi:hypothetical protein BCR42DRAFT_402939 [Absidia repens]|uniref:GATA-type domain-containing protein n=1 Tax=Absidia repens TaxID=90262 RepID=A0A1X2IYQ9_9FUNG|nr:hypothetical protein BCR42DRAFT_402939 [Absidia repens]
MSDLVKNEALSEMTPTGFTSSTWIADVFDCYEIPPEIGQDTVDPLDEHTHHQCQVRHLGPAYLKSGCFSAILANFYEITRSEISELKKVKRYSQRSSSGIGGTDTHLDTPDTRGGGSGVTPSKDAEALLYLSEVAHTPLPGSNSFTTANVVSSSALPPKKRKKRTVIQHCVIFSLTIDHQAHQDVSSLSPDCTYYLFPQNSLMNVVNDMAPFQIFCTFHLSNPSSTLQNTWTFSNNLISSHSPSSKTKYRTTLEEFAAVCDSSDRLLSIDPHDQVQNQLMDPSSLTSENQFVNVEISGAAGDVYYSLKQSVSGYQASCQKMANLLYLHNQRATSYKTESSLNLEHPLSSEQQSTLSKTHDQFVKSHHKKTKANIKSAGISSSSPNQQHDYIGQRQSSLTGGIEQDTDELDVMTINTKEWPGNKKKHSAIGTDNKIEDFDKDYVSSPTKKKKNKRNLSSRGKESSTGTRKCIYCNVTSTPMWRRGPEGAGTLCNACGVKWKHGKILSGYSNSSQNHGSSNTDPEEFNKKKVKTTTTTTKANRTKDTTSTTLDEEDSTDTPIDLHSLKGSCGHSESSITTNDSYHYQTFRSTIYDNERKLSSPSSSSPASTTTTTSTTTTATTTTASLTAMAMTKGERLHSTTSSTVLSSQHAVMLSSESIYNSPSTSFTSTPDSSPPMSMDSQQHRSLLALSYSEKLGLNGGEDALPLDAGADDVEAAAVLTLLRQS